jgi:hypothetical protein
MQLTSDQQQVVLGTLLGNSKIEISVDGPCLIMKSHDSAWFASKAEFLQDLHDSTWRQYGNYYWRSRPDECFEPFVKMCYKETQKFVTMDCLDRLRAIGIMVWYGDSGCLVGRGRRNACLRTQRLGDSAYVVAQFFNEVNTACCINLVRSKPVIVFTHEGTKTLMKIISQIIPPNRYHLIPSH